MNEKKATESALGVLEEKDLRNILRAASRQGTKVEMNRTVLAVCVGFVADVWR